MAAHIRNKRITYRDHLLRTCSLLDLACEELRSAISIQNAIALNYPNLCAEWFCWASQCHSVLHQMEARCQSLSMMASRVSRDTCDTPINLRNALMRYSVELEGKNETAKNKANGHD